MNVQNVNLYVTRRTPRRGPFSRPGLLLLTALLVGGGALWHLVEARRIDALRAELKRLDADRERIERQLAQIPSAGAALAQQIAAEERAVVALEDVVQRLGQGALSRAHGFTPPLRALARTHAEGVWLAGVRIDNVQGGLVLDGRALEASRVPAYLAALRRDPVFADTAFAALEARAAAAEPPYLEFTLRSTPRAAAGAADRPPVPDAGAAGGQPLPGGVGSTRPAPLNLAGAAR